MTNVGQDSILKGRYVIEEVLGTDRIGTNYIALDLRQKEVGIEDDHVSIKILHDDVVNNTGLLFSLQEEYSRAKSLQCENVVTIYDFDRDGGIRFLVTELLNDDTLEHYVSRREGRLPREEAYRIIHGICSALELAHSRDVLHTGLSPASILYSPNQVPKVFDFGVADLFAAIDQPSIQPSIYDSPEKLQTGISRETDDVFSVAVISYELLSGRHPFQGTPASVETRGPRRILSLMPGKWRALARGLAVDPGSRTATVREFSRELLD